MKCTLLFQANGSLKGKKRLILTLNGLSALKALRILRKEGSIEIASLPRVDLQAPHPGERGRWSVKDVATFLSKLGCLSTFSESAPLSVAVPDAKYRLRLKDVTNTVYSHGLPAGSFLDLGDGLFISSPELLFVELANIMSFEVLLLTGMELCGTFTRDAAAPRGGEVTYHVSPVTCVESILSFAKGCEGTRGLGPAKEALEWVLDNAWSPMEAVVATLAVLPVDMLGYGLWPIELNPRMNSEEGATKDSRVPDLVVRGTDVGINYDGEDHLPVQDVVNAAIRVAQSPDSSAEKELADAIARVRGGAVSDKRRDRDLASAGMSVLSMTKEDLYERGGLDRLVLQVIETIERKGKRRLDKQRMAISNRLLSELRQELIWSLLPGRTGTEHSVTYSKLMRGNPDPEHFMHRASFDGRKWDVVLTRRDEAFGDEPRRV